LRTFYYRLLRLLSLNIHPLFVFDGPNKPLFKRNKKVGGPGVRVASVPEFLAKQLLKQFGFPWHVAPGEAEAECALLQREGIVDAVLSEDVDTLMFGSGVTLRNWTPEGGGSGKTPTHVNVYRAEETLAGSGMDGPGMVLVALMSGGDYIPEGIPGCGPKVACDAARAGFGKELCNFRRSDKEGLKAWRERLQHEIRTNESKLFSRKNPKLVIPDDFPSAEVLGYYTKPCISSATKLAQLRETLRWDQNIDFPALRSFTGDAFDWRCVGGAKKFIRNLAPAMLVRRLRLIAEAGQDLETEAQEAAEAALVTKVHGKRNHKTTDGELEMRICFTPSNLVPIDLSIEDEEDDFLPAGQDENDSEPEDGFATLPSETPTETSDVEDAPTSPTKKARVAKPYDPDAAEKLWILKDFLQLGCPLLVEDYEASLRAPKETAKPKRKTTATTAGTAIIHAPKPRAPRKTKASKVNDMPANALMRHMQVTKAASLPPVAQASKDAGKDAESDDELPMISGFKLPSTQFPPEMMRKTVPKSRLPDDFFASSQPAPTTRKSSDLGHQRTPKKSNRLKRPSPEFSTPRVSRGRADIMAYFSPTPRANRTQSQGGPAGHSNKEKSAVEIIDLLSSSPMQDAPRDASPTPRQTRYEDADDILQPLPGTVTKRRKTRRDRGPLRKSLSAPVHTSSPLFMPRDESPEMDLGFEAEMETAGQSNEWQPSPSPRHHNYPAEDLPSDKTTTRPEPATRAPIFSFSSSQHSLPTPPAEPTSPAPLLSPRPEPGQSHDVTEDGFFRKRQAAQSKKPTTPPPTANPEPAARAQPATKQVPETITLSSSPIAPAPLPPQPSRPTHATTRPSPPPSRQSFPQPTTKPTAPSAPALLPKPASASKSKKPKTKHILLRPSLPGTWRAATDEEAEALDLTGDGSGLRKESAGMTATAGRGQNGNRNGEAKTKRSAWRTSGVEVLDLTGG
jgi:Holliday junction resolvase YEN1